MQFVACNLLHAINCTCSHGLKKREVSAALTVYDEDGDGDDACSEIARDTLVDAVVSQRHVNDRQVADVL